MKSNNQDFEPTCIYNIYRVKVMYKENQLDYWISPYVQPVMYPQGWGCGKEFAEHERVSSQTHREGRDPEATAVETTWSRHCQVWYNIVFTRYPKCISDWISILVASVNLLFFVNTRITILVFLGHFRNFFNIWAKWYVKMAKNSFFLEIKSVLSPF